jgi:sirohydrochlorin cobaltochelatase
MSKEVDSTHVVIVAHGSRDPDWKAPLQKLTADFKNQVLNHFIELAFMEFEKPYFFDRIKIILDSNTKASILVIPAFFSSGGHVSNDIREPLLKLKRHYPDAKIVIAEALGARNSVLQSMVSEIQVDLNRIHQERGVSDVE